MTPPRSPAPPPFDPADQGSGEPTGRAQDRLFERRVVFLSGRLDSTAANHAAIALMALDAWGDEAIHLQVDSSDGELEPALSLMDVIELLGVPVRATALGLVAGPAVGALALATHRLALPHARFRLLEPRTSFSGDAHHVHQLAEHAVARSRLFCDRLAAAVGQPTEHVEADLATGRFLSADEALVYGLIDGIVGPDTPHAPRPNAPIGFRPR